MDDLLIFLADNRIITKAGLISIITESFNSRHSFEQFSEKETLITRLKIIQPDILIISSDLFSLNIADDLAQIKICAPNMGILVVSTCQSHDKILVLLDSGISNCILQSCEKRELIEAVDATINHRNFLCSGILEILLARKTIRRKTRPNSGGLTTTEVEIVKLLSTGLTSKEIADRKRVSIHTIITHRKNIFRKLAINNSTELMLFAMRAGFIDVIDYSI